MSDVLAPYHVPTRTFLSFRPSLRFLRLLVIPLLLELCIHYVGPCSDTGHAQVSVELLHRIQECLIVVWEENVRSVFSVQLEACWNRGWGLCSLCHSA